MNLSFNSYFVSLGEASRNDYKIYIQMVNKNVATARFGFLINPKEDEEEIKILKIINDFNYNSVFLKAFYKNDNNTIIVVGFMDYLTNKDDLNFLRLINDFNLNVIGFRAYYEEEEENKDQDSFNLSFNEIYLAYENEITI